MEEQSVADLIDAVVARFGSLSILVNNAAPTIEVGTNVKRLADNTTEEWDLILARHADRQRVLELQVRHPAPRRRRRGIDREHLLGQSVIGIAGFAAYAAAKGGMNSVTRTIAVEEAPRNIRCNAIVVGRVLSKGTRAWGSPPARSPASACRRTSARPPCSWRRTSRRSSRDR